MYWLSNKLMLQVKLWLTFNEPLCTSWLGHGNGEHAPGIKDPMSSPFKAAHTIILAHTQTYQMYKKEFKAKQKGEFDIITRHTISNMSKKLIFILRIFFRF